MNRLIGRIVCAFKGHRRGKRASSITGVEWAIFQCPRCGAKWQRKTKGAANA